MWLWRCAAPIGSHNFISFNNISILCYAICKRNHRIIIGNVAEGIQYDTVCGGAALIGYIPSAPVCGGAALIGYIPSAPLCGGAALIG